MHRSGVVISSSVAASFRREPSGALRKNPPSPFSFGSVKYAPRTRHSSRSATLTGSHSVKKQLHIQTNAFFDPLLIDLCSHENHTTDETHS